MMNLLCTIVRGDSAVKNSKASITLGWDVRAGVRGRGHLFGGVGGGGSFKDFMIWKVFLTRQSQQGFQCFSFWQSDLLKSKAKVREERKRWLSRILF